MIIQEVMIDDFVSAFKDYGRENNFSYESLEALYDYLDEFSEETGEPFKLDVIAICCGFTEYSFKEFIVAYGTDEIIQEYENEDCVSVELIEEIASNKDLFILITDNYVIVEG